MPKTLPKKRRRPIQTIDVGARVNRVMLAVIVGDERPRHALLEPTDALAVAASLVIAAREVLTAARRTRRTRRVVQ